MSLLGVASILLLLGTRCDAWPAIILGGVLSAAMGAAGAAMDSTVVYRACYGVAQLAMVLAWVDVAAAAYRRDERAYAKIAATFAGLGWFVFFLVPNASDASSWAFDTPSITSRYYGQGGLEAVATALMLCLLAGAWARRREGRS